MELIEWVFTILSFIAYYFFISKKANQANFRLIGFILSLIIVFLMILFCFSIGLLSLVIINGVSLVFNAYGIYTCYREMMSKEAEVKNSNASNEMRAEKLIKSYSIEFQEILMAKINENLNSEVKN
jgi:hypothetical protein